MTKVEVLTSDQFFELYRKLYGYKYASFDLSKEIHYFNYNDGWRGGNKHSETLRFITAHNNKNILGVCCFAWWEGNQHYAVSYTSTNKNFFKQGISKLVTEELFKYFKQTYSEETLYMSGYSIDGWKYLHKFNKQMAEKYSVKLFEKPIEIITQWTDEARLLFDESRKELNWEERQYSY